MDIRGVGLIARTWTEDLIAKTGMFFQRDIGIG